MKKRHLLILIVYIMIAPLVHVSCAGIQQLKNPMDMNPTEKALFMLSVYNREFAAYMVAIGYAKTDDGTWEAGPPPFLSKERVDILKYKRSLFIKIKPLLATYVSYVNSGTIPDKNIENSLLILIDKLAYKK